MAIPFRILTGMGEVKILQILDFGKITVDFHR